MSRPLESILHAIGNTPIFRINKLSPDNVNMFVKVEGFNPMGSVKDRMAISTIEAAEKSGELKPGQTVIEATSGNTGIALAFIAQLMGLHMVLIMPENATEERVKTMKAYGAEVILTPAATGIEGSRDLAYKLRDEKGYVLLNQFENDDNWKAHYKTTGPEIWDATHKTITHFVATMGTTGTIMGTSKFLKEQNKEIVIVGAQPAEGAKIPGIRKWSPEYVPKFFDKSRVDITIDVTEEAAKTTTKLLAEKEGVFAGMSSGGSVYCALEIAKSIDKGVIVAIICDRGDRYLSSNLFE